MYLASPLLTVMTSADEQQPALLDSYLQSSVGDEASVGGTHGVMGDAASTHKEVPLAGADVVDGGSSTSGERSGAWCLLSPGCHSLPACAAFRSLSTSGRKAAVKTQGRPGNVERARPCGAENRRVRRSRWLHECRRTGGHAGKEIKEVKGKRLEAAGRARMTKGE